MTEIQHVKTAIVINPAEKGGKVVLLNKFYYVSEAIGQVEDTTFYQRLDGDPTEHFKSVIANSLAILIKQQKQLLFPLLIYRFQ